MTGSGDENGDRSCVKMAASEHIYSYLSKNNLVTV